jgi:BRCT domain type II-containing protein
MLDNQNPKNQYGDSGSVKTFRSTCRAKKPIDITNSSDEEEDSEDNRKNDHRKLAHKKSSPGNMSVDTSQSTQATSTISESLSSNPEQDFARMCVQNPDFLKRFLQSNPEIKTVTSGASKTPPQNADPQEASTEGHEASL